ncbi:hypothetical protein [Campylobacter concisus]|uniref:hypothetical protein n=1 Tax=Campylobacter concisus TaxID=199 RepID=UPI00122D0554|nr:hypothetical protein [Campylobacter concisus]
MSYQKKMLFYGLCSGNALIGRDIRWIVAFDTRLLNLTINRNLRLSLNISGAKFKKIKQDKFAKRSNKFELLENADIMCEGIACGYLHAVDYS